MDPDLTIVLLGKTGVGKSASGNTILGRPAFKSKQCLRSVTTEISERRGSVFGKQISVVDTPGILDSKETEKIEDFCQALLKSSRRCLFLVTLRVGRFTKEEQKALKTAMEVLGGRGLERSYLLFTGGDTLEGETLDDFIFEEGDEAQLPKVVQMFDGRYHLFNNKSGDEEQIRNLLLKSEHLKTEDQPDPPAGVPKERRIVMLGLPGAGKSSSGNTILRSERFESAAGFDSVSKETTSASASVEGCKVTVVDTPGFTDKDLTPVQLYLQIMKSVVEASPGVHAFVIVVRVGRITEADIKLFELLPKLFEGDALKHSMVLFTHGDNLKEGRSIEGLMEKNSHVSKLVSMCGGRYCVFDNRTKRSREQVRTFLSKIDEMVSANGGQHYTNQWFRMAETFLREEMIKAGAPGGGEEIKEIVWKKMGRYVLFGAVVAVAAVTIAVAGVVALPAAGIGAGVGAVIGAVGGAGTAVGAAMGTSAGIGAGVGAVIGAVGGAGTAVGVAVWTERGARAVGRPAVAVADKVAGAIMYIKEEKKKQ